MPLIDNIVSKKQLIITNKNKFSYTIVVLFHLLQIK
jgi:hypothetical protein